jgi:hypothetical protein
MGSQTSGRNFRRKITRTMLKPKQFQLHKTYEPKNTETKYVFNKPKNWFLSKLWDFLYKKKYIKSHFDHEMVVKYENVELTDDDEKEIMNSVKNFLDFGHHYQDLIILIGNVKFMEMLHYRNSLQSNLILHSRSQTIFGIPVVVVGYIDGVLVINKNDLKGL